MKTVFIYQVLDCVSEGVISTFIGPNDRYAVREFKKLLSDPKIKDSIEPSDFCLVKSDVVSVAESYADYDDLESVVSCGADLFPDSDCPEKCSDDCLDCARKKF